MNKLSVITANFKPLRFVLRDLDKWEPTLEQINYRNYDYVKLHRLSTVFDIGISPYSLGVCFDGTLVLPALPKFREVHIVLNLVNKTLAELLVGGVYCEAVSPADLGYGTLSFDGYSKICGGNGPVVSFHRAARSKHIGTLDVISLLEPQTINILELHRSLHHGRELLSKVEGLPHEQILYGTTFFVNKQWAESLIHIWTATERVVEIAWQKHVIRDTAYNNKKRREFLNDHRTWSVATKLEVLFQKGLLNLDTYEKLSMARKFRNDFAHRGSPPNHDISLTAIEACFELTSLCSSEFLNKNLFCKATSAVKERCNPEFFPTKQEKLEDSEYWLSMPPIPGDKKWGDKAYEIIDELILQPIDDGSMPKIDNKNS